MTDARAAIHAMFQLDEAATAELDRRLDALDAESLRGFIHHLEYSAGDSAAEKLLEDAPALAALLAGEKATAEAAPTPDFFQVGHTYARDHHGRTIEFHVIHIATALDCDFPTAFGWRKDPQIDVMLPMDADDFHGCGWTDVTEAGESRG